MIDPFGSIGRSGTVSHPETTLSSKHSPTGRPVPEFPRFASEANHHQTDTRATGFLRTDVRSEPPAQGDRGIRRQGSCIQDVVYRYVSRAGGSRSRDKSRARQKAKSGRILVPPL